MSERQLALDGRELELVPTTRALTARQRDVLRFVRLRGVVRPVEIGRMMHATREGGMAHVLVTVYGEGAPRACCRWASSDGYDALRRLERRRLVYRESRGRWRVVVAVEDWSAP